MTLDPPVFWAVISVTAALFYCVGAAHAREEARDQLDQLADHCRALQDALDSMPRRRGGVPDEESGSD